VSLGEVRNRGDLIMFWGSNPAESHPRHFTKYSLMPKGMFVPNGRKDRTCVWSTSARRKAPRRGHFSADQAAGDFEALWTLRALAKDIDWIPSRSSTTPACRCRSGRI
jgi:formylmethanofuran dehydrogenase subunit B